MSLSLVENAPEPAIVRPDDAKFKLIDLVAAYSSEVTPAQAARLPDLADILPAGTDVSVTCLPGSAFADTVETSRLVKDAGLVPIPHFAARGFTSRDHLYDCLARLQGEVNVDNALVIAGGLDKAAGPFESSMDLLDTGLFERFGIRRIGVAGHPEGSPDISPAAVMEALAWKNQYARGTGAEMYLVTQFCFEAEPIIEWAAELRRWGNELPIHVGIPGPANLKTLINYARLCGIGPSMRALTRQTRNFSRLMTISAPVALLADLARHVGKDGQSNIVKCHVYPLGGVKRMADWLHEISTGNFYLQPDQRHFVIGA